MTLEMQCADAMRRCNALRLLHPTGRHPSARKHAIRHRPERLAAERQGRRSARRSGRAPADCMPSREPGDGTKGKHDHAEKQQHGVNREICRTEPIVLACMGELVRQEPSPMLGEQRRFHDDDVPDGDRSPTLETSGGQTVEPRARRLAADALRVPATEQPGCGVPDQGGGRGPDPAYGADCAIPSGSRDRDASQQAVALRAFRNPACRHAAPRSSFRGTIGYCRRRPAPAVRRRRAGA